MLVELGPVKSLPALNSLYLFPEREQEQVDDLRKKITSMDLSSPVVMLTHQFTIRALVGTTTRSGEIVVLRRGEKGKLSIIGKIAPRPTD